MFNWNLSQLPPGASTTVTQIGVEPYLRGKLLALGLVPGTRVACLHRAPSGSPITFRVRGAAIALRARDAARILVSPWQ